MPHAMPKDAMPEKGSTESASIAVARRVLRMEIDGLHRLAEGLGERFAAAIEIIAAVRGPGTSADPPTRHALGFAPHAPM